MEMAQDRPKVTMDHLIGSHVSQIKACQFRWPLWHWKARPERPNFGGVACYVCSYRLTNIDQIGHGNWRGRFSMGRLQRSQILLETHVHVVWSRQKSPTCSYNNW